MDKIEVNTGFFGDDLEKIIRKKIDIEKKNREKGRSDENPKSSVILRFIFTYTIYS